jgi:8-oxo-dGTP pyrophosphatase MutT (NUDIX family)
MNGSWRRTRWGGVLGRSLYRCGYYALRAYVLLLRRPSRGVKCVLGHGGEVLVVRHTYGPPGWELPGGGLHRGEDPLAAARREMAEELGLAELGLQALGVIAVHLHGRWVTLHLFGAELPERAVDPDPVEIGAVGWIPRAGLVERLPPYAAELGGLL